MHIESDVAEEHVLTSKRLVSKPQPQKGSFDVSFDEYVDGSTMDNGSNGRNYENLRKHQLDSADDVMTAVELENNTNEMVKLLLPSANSLEKIWELVMKRLVEKKIRVQSIESRIIDLTNWTQVEWTRILKTKDKTALLRLYQRKLSYESIDKKVVEFFEKPQPDLRSLEDLKVWRHHLKGLGSEDGKLASQMLAFFHRCLRREVNILTTPLRERDYIVKVLSPLLGILFEECDIGRFQVYWIEKASRAVTQRKRRKIHAEYVQLGKDSVMVDMIVASRSLGVELLSLEAGNTEDIDDLKTRGDHSALKIELKDMLDSFCEELHFKKSDFVDVFTIGIQVLGNRWTIYALSYDYEVKFYFLSEMATLDVPTTLSSMDDLLIPFVRCLLGLRHTLLLLNKKISNITRARHSTPSPASSPPHETTRTPEVKRVKEDIFSILDNIY